MERDRLVPTGLYAIRGKASLHVGERVAIEPPPELRRLLAERHYLPTGVPLLKRIAAVRGQRVCRFASWHHHRRPICRRGACRATAWAAHCRHGPAADTLRTGELFVMNPAAPDSFDGRYFGVLRMTDVIGRATPVWTDEAGNGDHVWFADPRASEPSPTTNQGD